MIRRDRKEIERARGLHENYGGTFKYSSNTRKTDLKSLLKYAKVRSRPTVSYQNYRRDIILIPKRSTLHVYT